MIEFEDHPTEPNTVVIKMPKRYIAKHSDEDLRTAVLAEREACVKKLNAMIIGCVDVINEDDVHEDAKKLAKLVKKDCYEILQNLEEKT